MVSKLVFAVAFLHETPNRSITAVFRRQKKGSKGRDAVGQSDE